MAITNGYCTLAQVRLELGGVYTVGDTSDDSMIELAIEAASRQIDGYCGRRFWQDSSVVDRQYHALSPVLVDTDDISTTTGLVVKTDDDGDGTFETTLTITTDFLVLPTNAADEVPARPYTEILLAENYSFPRPSNGRPGVQVSAKFGWPAVPDNVEKAAIIQAIQLFKAKDAPFGVASFGDMGGGMRVGRGLNPIAQALVDQYAKPSIG